MTTKREIPDGTTITYTSAGRLTEDPTHPEGFTYGCSRTIDTPCEVLP